jgi:hypothetical protein
VGCVLRRTVVVYSQTRTVLTTEDLVGRPHNTGDWSVISRPHCTQSFFLIALCPQTPKHIRDDWSHYTYTSEPVDGNVAQNIPIACHGPTSYMLTFFLIFKTFLYSYIFCTRAFRISAHVASQ